MSGIVNELDNIYTSPAYKCWRLVIDGTVAIHLWEGTGVARSMKRIFISDRTDTDPDAVTSAAGKQQCMDYIAAEHLTDDTNKPPMLPVKPVKSMKSAGPTRTRALPEAAMKKS